jgi:hypothetical protein
MLRISYIHRGNRRAPPAGVTLVVFCGGCDGAGDHTLTVASMVSRPARRTVA